MFQGLDGYIEACQRITLLAVYFIVGIKQEQDLEPILCLIQVQTDCPVDTVSLSTKRVIPIPQTVCSTVRHTSDLSHEIPFSFFFTEENYMHTFFRIWFMPSLFSNQVQVEQLVMSVGFQKTVLTWLLNSSVPQNR